MTPRLALLFACALLAKHAVHCLTATPGVAQPPGVKVPSGAWLEFRRNAAQHSREVAQSDELGYTRIKSLPPASWAVPDSRAYDVSPQATGMGPACPFAPPDDAKDVPLPLVFETLAPIASADECQMIIDETQAHIDAGKAGSGFTLTDTCTNIAVADLPSTLNWLNTEGLPRVAAVAGRCFGEDVIGDPKGLLVYRALVVHYDADAGLTHQEVHRDGSFVTCVITLNPSDEYTGGGTFMEALGEALAPDQGHGVLQASALRHAGHVIDSGERWVLVLFLIAEEMRFGENVRHLKTRAQRLAEDGEYDDETACLELARTLCDDCDHEIVYDQAVGEHERGNLEAAKELYERADVIANGVDERVKKNLAAVRAALSGVSSPELDEAAAAITEAANDVATFNVFSEQCDTGDDVACETLSREGDAKKAWLAEQNELAYAKAAAMVSKVAEAATATAYGGGVAEQDEATSPWFAKLNAPTWEDAAQVVSKVVAEAAGMANLSEQCHKGDDAACETLSREEEAKAAYIGNVGVETWDKIASAVSVAASSGGNNINAGAIAATPQNARMAHGTVTPTGQTPMEPRPAAATTDLTASYEMVVSEIGEECYKGDDAACQTLSREAEARASWLASGAHQLDAAVRLAGGAASDAPAGSAIQSDTSWPWAAALYCCYRQQLLASGRRIKTPASIAPTPEEARMPFEQRQTAMYSRLVMELESECHLGDDVACETVSIEEQSKSAWLARYNDEARDRNAPTNAAPATAGVGAVTRDPEAKAE